MLIDRGVFLPVACLGGGGVRGGGGGGVSSAAGRFSSSQKCPVHLLSCSWTVIRGFPCLPLTGLSVLWYLPANLLVMYRAFVFRCAAASSVLPGFSVWAVLSALILLLTSV